MKLGERVARALGRWALRNWRELAFLTAVVATPIVILNLAVAYFGDTNVFPLSPYSLKPKASAVGRYLIHRPICMVTGHEPLEPLIEAAERKHGLPRGLLKAV